MGDENTNDYGRDINSPVYNQVRWSLRDAEIKDSKGNVINARRGLETPSHWSDLSVKIVGTKYLFIGDTPSKPTETSVRQMIHRVADSITREGIKYGHVKQEEAAQFYDEVVSLVLNQKMAFNSPVWFNVGLYEQYGVKEKRKREESSHWAYEDGKFSNSVDAYERPQGAACFIQSIDDNMESILEHAKKEGMLFKYGSGTGTNFSPLRGINEPLSGGGVASGEISFMRIYDIIAGRIQSGGKTRRAAKMVITDDDHPDLMRFIWWKVSEEKKALWLSARPELGPQNPGDLESEAYKTVDGQNGNNSIRVSDKFMEAALRGAEWDLNFRTANKESEEKDIPLSEYKDDRYLPDKRFVKKLTTKRKVVNAGEVLENIARAAYVTGDPGLQFDDNINRWNTCSNSGRQRASNPCSEFMFLDDSACNLASLRLTQFKGHDGKFDVPEFKRAVRATIESQDILVDKSSYPSERIARNSHYFRPLGLGYTDLGALVMSYGLAYDSDEGRALASALTSLMTATAYEKSADMAAELGPFAEFEKNKEPMLKVIEQHRDEARKVSNLSVSNLEEILHEGNAAWQRVYEKGSKYGFRNAQVTLLAPTGTIGFMMDVDCTGVEPMLALQSNKGLAGGGEIKRERVPPCVVHGLQALGYKERTLENILAHIAKNGSVISAPGLEREHYGVFATAFGDNTLSVDAHLGMVAAVQPFLSGAISKTVNLPKGSTIQDIKDIYVKAWKLGIKSVTPYVDGSKGMQPVNIKVKQKETELKWGDRDKPGNPMERFCQNTDINKTGVHVMVGEYSVRPPKDSPADFFVEFGSSGSPFSATFTDWAKEASWNRQRGETLDEFIRHHRGSIGPINGFTNHPFIKTCSSIGDFAAKLVMLEYLGDTSACDVQPTEEALEKLRCNVLAKRRRWEHFDSRIRYIDKIMNEGKVTEIKPLFADDVKKGSISMGELFCTNCGHATVLSGANCRKCPNCGESGGCG